MMWQYHIECWNWHLGGLHLNEVRNQTAARHCYHPALKVLETHQL